MTKAAYAPHLLDQDNIRALRRDIIVVDMEFNERISSGGLILPSDNGTSAGIRPRWGRVYAVGSEQTDVRVGQWICVEHGRWTRGLEIENADGTRLTIRKIDHKSVMLVANSRPSDDTQSDCIDGRYSRISAEDFKF